MIIIKLNGGLASQIHKYCIGKALSIKYNVPLKFDLSWFNNTPLADTQWQYELDVYQLGIEIALPSEINRLKGSNFFVKINNKLHSFFGLSFHKRTYFNKSFLSFEEFNAIPSEAYLEGEWAGDKYFQDIRPLLLSELTIQKISDSAKQIKDKILTSNNTVSIHIRRGDYISNPNASSFHGICDLDYYKHAITKFKQTLDTPLFFIFSDDIPWCKSHLTFERNLVFITDTKNYEDLALISLCNHHILSNSGFSWLGAWLNNAPNKIIIAPKQWVINRQMNAKLMKDLIFGKWELL